MKHKRPVNLNLLTIRFPIPAIVSILHRITGVILFLMLPFMLWGLSLSLASQDDFDAVQRYLDTPFLKFIVWGTIAAFIFHLVAGLRHLLMDLGIGEELKSGRLSAKLTLIISVVLIVLAGIWLW
ncbi:MAG: succinate dehydrogenase, cytochrome b556 subunit [Gammaproteobacteria bacterium]